jgi:hypothetical protein
MVSRKEGVCSSPPKPMRRGSSPPFYFTHHGDLIFLSGKRSIGHPILCLQLFFGSFFNVVAFIALNLGVVYLEEGFCSGFGLQHPGDNLLSIFLFHYNDIHIIFAGRCTFPLLCLNTLYSQKPATSSSVVANKILGGC